MAKMKNLKFEIQNVKNDFYVDHFKKRISHTVHNAVALGVGLPSVDEISIDIIHNLHYIYSKNEKH